MHPCTNSLFCLAQQLLRSLSLPLPFGAHRLALHSCWRVVGSPLPLAHSDLVSARLARPWPWPRPTRPQLAMLCECVYAEIIAPTVFFCWAHHLLRSLSLPLPFRAHRLALHSCWRVVGSLGPILGPILAQFRAHGGAHKRIVGALLTQINSINSNQSVN
jgi:hypothetical protein